ncbi:DUF732 domain-containing protein [Mycolicibacterium sp.]|uniref:DUF732 domain-containing protein n=1 Tax=Mycolicibacterium sp. TaxID=2320850 RepID=UPI0037C82126
MRRASMLGVVAAAGIALAAPAHATPEDDYLGILSDTPGFTVNPFTSVLLTQAGNTICADLRGGMSPQDSANKMMFYPGSTNAATKAMVAAAQQTMCPDTQGAA